MIFSGWDFQRSAISHRSILSSGLVDFFDPNANGIVHSIALAADGKDLSGWRLQRCESIGGQTRDFFARC